MTTVARPEFIRLPKPKANCPHTGFSRTGLYNLCVPCSANGFKPAVPAKCLRQPGNLRGVWLIPYERLIAYINALPTPGMRQTNSGAGNPGPVVEAGQPAGMKASAGLAAQSQSQRRRPARRTG